MIRKIINFISNFSFRLFKSFYRFLYWWITIHTFWDSHAVFAWNKILSKKLHIVTHTLWPKLMYSVWRDWLNLLDISKPEYWVKDWDNIVFCFGEIDCRCHIHKYQLKWVKNVIESMIDSYMETIVDNVSLFRKLKVYVYNVVPPASNSWRDNDPDFPFLWSDNDRLWYVMRMNNQIKSRCEDLGFTYVDIFDQYSDIENMLDERYSDGHVHIKNPKYLQQFLELNIV